MADNKSSYRNIMKGTAIFGGTQIYNVLVGIIRGKLVAMILGPIGMGISSLFTTAIAPIQQFSTLGMPLSAVRYISGEVDENERKRVVKAFRMMLWAAAIVGAVITILSSEILSNLTFGEDGYTWSFVALSLAVFFTVLYQGENTILQGYRRLKSLALLSVVGSTAGLILGIPLYYFLGTQGIVPAMIVLAFVTYVTSLYGTRQIGLKVAPISWMEAWGISKNFLMLGITMMVAVILGMIVTYALNIVIRHYGTIVDVGLFQAANSIVNQYVGMVFAAMATDYYPHLSSIIQDREKTSELVHQQGEIVLLLVVPLSVLIIISAPVLIQVLLTEEFYPVLDIIRFMGLGVILKAACFPLGYLSIAHGDRMFYFGMEGIWTNVKWILLFGSFYIIWGFKGLGWAVIVNSFIDIIVGSIMNWWRYRVCYNFKYYLRTLILYLGTSSIIIFSFISNLLLSYVLMVMVGIVLCLYCYIELDKKIDIKAIVLSKLHKNNERAVNH